jgi:hypothetical protein
MKKPSRAATREARYDAAMATESKTSAPATPTRRGAQHERELTAPVDLCDARGNLNPASVGWSRQPLHHCNVSGHTPRKKRWNYWCLNTDKLLFSATIADVDHYVLAFVYLFDLETRRLVERTAILPPGAIDLPPHVRADAVFEQGGRRVAFTEEKRGTRIAVTWPDFDGAPLAVDLLVERAPAHETMNVVIPWSRERFQFTSKQNCLPVTGTIMLGTEKVQLARKDHAYACLDFGRGVWKYRTAWNWGSASAMLPDGRALGLQLGAKWTDGTGMTENAIFLDGRISKLSEDIPFVYDEHDFMKPWRIKAKSKRVDLRFTPFHERVAKAKTGILSSEVHQLFGYYDGTVTPDSGECIAVEQVFGWIEEHKARW